MIHTDVNEIMSEDAEKHGVLPADIQKRVDVMLQYAWNRGYKGGYENRDETWVRSLQQTGLGFGMMG